MPAGNQPDTDPGPARIIAPALVFAFALVTCWLFVAPGHPLTVDVWPHLARQKVMYESLRDGRSPFYSFMFYSGYPHLRFYSPLFYVLSGLATFATGGEVLFGTRITLVILHLLSGLAMYVFLLRRTRSPVASALGAISFLIVPWRSRHIAILACYPQVLIYGLAPVALLCLDRLLERPDRRRAVILGLVLALAPLSHVYYGSFLVAFVLLFLLLSRPSPAALKSLLLSGLVLLLLTAFFAVPFLAEFRSHAFPQTAQVNALPDLRVLAGLVRKTTGYSGGYLGLSLLVLLLGSLALLILKARAQVRTWLAPALGLLITLAWVFVVPRFGGLGQLLSAGLPPERFLLFFVFFSSLLIALGWTELERRRHGRRIPDFGLPVAALGVLVFVSLDCLPGQLRSPYPDKTKLLAGRNEAYKAINVQQPIRLLDIGLPTPEIDYSARICGYPASGFLYGNLASPLGPPYHQFAPRAMHYVYPWVNAVAQDMMDPSTNSISPASFKVMILLGASHIIMQPHVYEGATPGPEDNFFLVKRGIAWNTDLLTRKPAYPLAFGSTGAGLCLAAPRLRPLPDSPLVKDRTFLIASDWQVVLDSTVLGPYVNTLTVIPIPAGQRAESLPGIPAIEVPHTTIRHHEVAAEVQASTDCFLRLALSYYPWLLVRLDGRPTEFKETKDHFIWLRCPKGKHVISVTAPLTPLRSVTLWLSGLCFLACIALIAIPCRKQQLKRA